MTDQPAWFLSTEELAATRTKLATILERAHRKGFTGAVALDAVPATRVRHPAGGLPVTVHGFDVTITGTPPAYQGWRFLAAVDNADGGAVVRYPPGRDTTVRNDDLVAGRCDHCLTTRTRRSTFLVRHDDTGQLLQVGRSCLKDFLGHNTTPVLLTEDALRATLAVGRTGSDSAWDTRQVIAYASAAVQAFGWTPSSAAGRRPATRDQVATLLAHGRGADDLLRAVAPHLPEAHKLAPTIIATLLTELTEPTGYEANLTAVLRGEAVGVRHLGLAVSAITAHQRLGNRPDDTRSAAEAAVPVDWLGAVGERVTVTGSVRTALRVDGYTRSSPDPLLLILECPGAVIKMTTTAGWADGVHRGDTLTLTGTVKAHTEWNGVRQTVMVRAKPATVSPDAANPDAISPDAASPGPRDWEQVAPRALGRPEHRAVPSLARTLAVAPTP